MCGSFPCGDATQVLTFIVVTLPLFSSALVIGSSLLGYLFGPYCHIRKAFGWGIVDTSPNLGYMRGTPGVHLGFESCITCVSLGPPARRSDYS